jgi:hypothetical protein
VPLLDLEPNNTMPGQALAPDSSGGYRLAGGLDVAGDVDVYTITVSSQQTRLSVSTPPIGEAAGPGVSTFGSTLRRFTATVQSSTGQVLGRLAPPTGAISSMATDLSVPVNSGTYRLVISRPAGLTVGANDFYATTVETPADSTAEGEGLGFHANDTTGTAELLFTVNQTAKLTTSTWHGFLPAGDVDTFYVPSILGVAGSTIEVSCGAARVGSGLSGFTVSVLGASANVLQTETEVATADLAWSAAPGASKPVVTLPATGTVYFKLSASSVSATNTGTYYRCAVSILNP